MARLGLLCTMFLAAVQVAVPALADQGKALFEKECASCHTIGGGDTGGPDLKGVGSKRSPAWLVRVIAEPDKLTAEKDPVQLELVKKYGYEMPNLGISTEDARTLAAFLKGALSAAKAPAKGAPAEGKGAVSAVSAAAATQAPEAPAPEAESKQEIPATPELIRRGQALLTGASPFANGGAPCTACHAFTYPGVAGGNLASDLTYIYDGMGEQGMQGVLKSLKFPIMKKAYADRPLTEEEITALVAFARDAAARTDRQPSSLFPAAGAGVFLVCMAGLTLYKRRIR